MKANFDKRNRRSTVELLWDIQKCFEHVNQDILWQICSGLDYPMAFLRLSLHTYAAPRFVMTDFNIVGPPIMPSHGITAGSAMACQELTAYVYSAMRRIKELNNNVTTSLFVDDLFANTSHRNPSVAATQLAEVAEHIVE